MPHPTGPTNQRTIKLAREFRKKKDKIYADVAKKLMRPARSKTAVNVQKLQKLSKNHSNFVIPGKVLGIGEIDKAVNVYAFSYSKEAKAKIQKAGGKAHTLGDLLKEKVDKIKIVV